MRCVYVVPCGGLWYRGEVVEGGVLLEWAVEEQWGSTVRDLKDVFPFLGGVSCSEVASVVGAFFVHHLGVFLVTDPSLV